MCGILCEICFTTNCCRTLKDEKVRQRIRNRGPNCIQTVEIKISADITVSFCGAVLWMQGTQLTPQPLENSKGVLLYNGDIFDETWNSDVSDTQIIVNQLSHQTIISTEAHMLKVLKSLKGPFSLIYYDKSTQNLYFSRDKIGRSTMLFHHNDSSIVISSVLSRNYECVEVPATYIYCLDIIKQKIKLLPWDDSQAPDEYSLETWLENLHVQQRLPDDEFTFCYDENADLCDHDNVINYIESIAKETKCKSEVMKQILANKIMCEVVSKVTELLEKV